MSVTTRRDFLKCASLAAAASFAGLNGRYAHAAEFTLKYANNLPATHPMNIRAKEAAARIASESKGRVDFQVYSNNQLGSDTDMLSQVRSGAIDYFTLSPLILGTLVPAAQITGVGFAFKDYGQVWPALDGAPGARVRQEIAKTSVFAFDKIWDNGYRQTTTSTKPIHLPGDLKGIKLRVPMSPIWTSMFQALGASPASINFSEVYSSLQTRVVEGQENPLATITAAKLYEVQKYCSLTNHMWDGFWFLANKQSFARLPKDLQTIVQNAVNDAAMKEREDVAKLNASLMPELKAKGLQFNDVDINAFRRQLTTTGFYADWHKKFGDDAWTALETYTGKLA
ncbi:TRAP transporter substrate-binding protein [Paraburkholderia sediminicola]|uniref:TRAP transporter substrate-binding protein n=1 Tax=Paraburkholderia sediminicola TaxID=458836 RepID=UPI0038BB8FC2